MSPPFPAAFFPAAFFSATPVPTQRVKLRYVCDDVPVEGLSTKSSRLAGADVIVQPLSIAPAHSTYQLHPGYNSVPGLLDSFAKGLPHKVAADANSKLVFFGYIDVGMLNTVVELWRYPSLAASIEAREAARKVPEWRKCIADVTPSVQHFRTQALIPTKFSPLR